MERVYIAPLADMVGGGDRFQCVLTMVVFFPAAWLVPILEKQTAGRLTLGDARGTLWHGSAFIGGAAGVSDPVTPPLPGRFSWRLSPAVYGKRDCRTGKPCGAVTADQR